MGRGTTATETRPAAVFNYHGVVTRHHHNRPAVLLPHTSHHSPILHCSAAHCIRGAPLHHPTTHHDMINTLSTTINVDIITSDAAPTQYTTTGAKRLRRRRTDRSLRDPGPSVINVKHAKLADMTNTGKRSMSRSVAASSASASATPSPPPPVSSTPGAIHDVSTQGKRTS